MKTKSLLALVLVWLTGTASMAVAQAPAIAHNTWSSGAPLPTAVFLPAVATLKGKIYVMGGGTNADGTVIADTQIYDPAKDTWSAGVPLPTTLGCGAAAVVKNVLYVMGGSSSGQVYDYTNAVWAFSASKKTWSAKAAMPIALCTTGVTVENNIIYVVGGNSTDDLRASTVESYNPATDTWTVESSLLLGRSEPSVGRVGNKKVGFTIVAAGGTVPWGWTGDTESYDMFTKTWGSLTPDPKERAATCTGAVGSRLYRAGGLGGDWGRPINLTESFSLSQNNWETLVSVPQAVAFSGSAVYKGRLYCLGGMYDWIPISNVQIYQP